jgi:hypothetical protein
MQKLTETQHEFVKALFGPAANGNLNSAAKEIGIDDYTMLMTQELIEAIKKRADMELVMNVPKAVHVMSKILNNPEEIGFMDKLHKVAADVLDRAGISKQERPQAAGTNIGLVFLPDKKLLPEPPSDETIDQNISLSNPQFLQAT